MENQEQKPKKNRHGGYREGAGRKPAGAPKTEVLNTRCTKVVRERLEAYAKKHGCPLAQAIEDIVLAANI